MKTYIVWYETDWTRYMRVLETNNLYEWIGKKICNTIERTYNFRYKECKTDEDIKISIEYAVEKGWVDLTKNKLYYKEKTK